jgi:hypothetical protein
MYWFYLSCLQVGRAGRFGTKGLAISFVSTKEEGEVLNDVQSRFVVRVEALPEQIDASTYSKLVAFILTGGSECLIDFMSLPRLVINYLQIPYGSMSN